MNEVNEPIEEEAQNVKLASDAWLEKAKKKVSLANEKKISGSQKRKQVEEASTTAEEVASKISHIKKKKTISEKNGDEWTF